MCVCVCVCACVCFEKTSKMPQMGRKNRKRPGLKEKVRDRFLAKRISEYCLEQLSWGYRMEAPFEGGQGLEVAVASYLDGWIDRYG